MAKQLKWGDKLPFLIGGVALATLVSGTGYWLVKDAVKQGAAPASVSSVQGRDNNESVSPLARLLEKQTDASIEEAPHYEADNLSGAFLSSLFAQRNGDWQDAALYMDELQHFHGANPVILKKAIVLEMGANNPQAAIKAAQDYLKLDAGDDADHNSRAFASLFIIAGEIQKGHYDVAAKKIKEMPQDGLTSFMKPILSSWIETHKGKFDKSLLQAGHTLHILNAAYVSDYLGDKDRMIEILDELARFGDLNFAQQERLADMYLIAGQEERAHTIYQRLFNADPSLERLQQKAQLKADAPAFKALSLYAHPASINDGLALSMYDMAALLNEDKAYDSARLFANLALYLKPNLYDATLLKAQIAAALEEYTNALSLYQDLPQDYARTREVGYLQADIYDRAQRSDEAVALLRGLYKQTENPQALVAIADIKRRHQQFKEALTLYNQALEAMSPDKKKVGQAWHIYYARGMVQEQLGHWVQAKADLVEALEGYPDHPFVLNYLGYAMIDRGEDLDQALGMIEKALSMQPHDGYITDSLGWAHYKMGHYDQAVPYLERAVELLPADAVVNDHLGDVYWQVGRRLEARYQWKRARLNLKQNPSEDQDLLAALVEKLSRGLQPVTLAQDKVGQAPASQIKVELLDKNSATQ